MGGQGWEFSPILAIWLVSVSYRRRHLVVCILVGIFCTVPFGGIPVLTSWRELHYGRIWQKLPVVGIFVDIIGTVPFGGDLQISVPLLM
jgi:hypothetical protein